MERGQISPPRLAELRTVLAGKYARARDIWDDYETKRFDFMSDENHPSVAKAEVLFNATEEGKNWRKWKSDLKKIEKMLSSLKTQLEVAQTEAYNTY